jgi:hypothetical protein
MTGFSLRLQVELASSIDWAQLSRFHLKTETESRMMDNVQKYNS